MSRRRVVDTIVADKVSAVAGTLDFTIETSCYEELLVFYLASGAAASANLFLAQVRDDGTSTNLPAAPAAPGIGGTAFAHLGKAVGTNCWPGVPRRTRVALTAGAASTVTIRVEGVRYEDDDVDAG